ncbi:MAG: glycosylase [Cyclobacteriaceae bacterium]
MKYLHISASSLLLVIVLLAFSCKEKQLPKKVSQDVMEKIYEQIKTPYKYGLVLAPEDQSKKIDCPTVFQKDGKWFMTYFIFDGRGYETWLAESDNLLDWSIKGRVMAFSDSTDWDANQKAGYPSLQDPKFGGSYALNKFDGKYWMPYFGGSSTGYESGLLAIGMAHTNQDPSTAHLWNRLEEPIFKPTDEGARWWENGTIYKTWVLQDDDKTTGYPFVMYYNARGDSINPKRGAERIGMAVSNDMVHWDRFGKEPIINHHKGISGDAVIQKIDDVWVMFYFGAFWPTRKDHDAFNRFACSYDLVNWTEWEGKDLIAPSEPYDNWFAHKSYVIKHEGVVYHFYCATNRDQQRGIAVATSSDLGKSEIEYYEDPLKESSIPKK